MSEHLHTIIDTDPAFAIDTVTRLIVNNGDKIELIQYDHKSERFTFSMPRYVEGHDMLGSYSIMIVYENSNLATKEISKGVYQSTDGHVDENDENRILFSWLLTENATRYAGSLTFGIRITCDSADGTIFSWGTNLYSGVSIAKGIAISDDDIHESEGEPKTLVDTDTLNVLLTRTITELENNEIDNVGVGACAGCTQLTRVSVPNANIIHDMAFYICIDLTDLYMPNAVTIKEFAFKGCTSLSEIDLPKAYDIESRAFFNTTNLSVLSLPNVNYIGNNAFACDWSDETYPLEDIYLPMVEIISEHAFSNRNNVKNIILPKIQRIGNNAFEDNVALDTVDLGAIEYIGDKAFYVSANSGSIRLWSKPHTVIIRTPDKVCELGGSSVFGNYFNQSLYIFDDEGNYTNTREKPSVYVPDDLVEDYKVATYWSTYADLIKPLSEYDGDGSESSDIDDEREKYVE